MNQSPNEGEIPKAERLVEVFRRLDSATACSTFDEAYRLLCETMDEVEDELTSFPNEPDRWRELGRLFPPQMDRMSSVGECNGVVKRFDSRRHLTYVADNGAMEFRSLRLVDGEVKIHFSKASNDGRTICEVCPALKEKNL